MNSINTLNLSSSMNIPYKLLQKLSLGQTKMIEYFSTNMLICFKEFIVKASDNEFQAALLSIDLPMRDTEYPAGKFLSGLMRLKIMNSISEKEKNMLLTAISRAPSSGLVNIPLFIQIWNHWYLNKDTLIEDKIDMNENEKQIYYLIKLKYDKLLHIIETLSIRLKSVLSPLSSIDNISLGDFRYLLDSIGIKLIDSDYQLLEIMLKECGFVVNNKIVMQNLIQFLDNIKHIKNSIDKNFDDTSSYESRFKESRLIEAFVNIWPSIYKTNKNSPNAICQENITELFKKSGKIISQRDSDFIWQYLISKLYDNSFLPVKIPLEDVLKSFPIKNYETYNASIPNLMKDIAQTRHKKEIKESLIQRSGIDLKALYHQDCVHDLPLPPPPPPPPPPLSHHHHHHHHSNQPRPPSCSSLPWESSEIIRLPEKRPEKRHIKNNHNQTPPSHLNQLFSSNIDLSGKSNVYQRLLLRTRSFSKAQSVTFLSSLVKDSSCTYNSQGEITLTVVKQTLLNAFLSVDIRINHIDAEKLWGDISTTHIKNNISPLEVLDMFHVSLDEDTIKNIFQEQSVNDESANQENAPLFNTNTDRFPKSKQSKSVSAPSSSKDLVGNTQNHSFIQSVDNLLIPDSKLEYPNKAIQEGYDIIGEADLIANSLGNDSEKNRIDEVDKFSKAIKKLREKKIVLALEYRRYGNGGVSGMMLLDILLREPISLDMTFDEAYKLICDIAKISYSSDIESFTVSYQDVMDFLDSRLPTGKAQNTNLIFHDEIKRKLSLSKDVQGSKIKLLALTNHLRFRLKNLCGKGEDYVSWDSIPEDLSTNEIMKLFSYIDINFTPSEVNYIIKCLANIESSDLSKNYAEESRMSLPAIILFLANSVL